MKTLFLALFALTAASLTYADRLPRKDFITRVESCEAILREFMSIPETAIPASVWARARGIVIVNQFKAGFILGVKDGYGVVLVKKPNGRWSVPVLINAGEASLGLQLGGTAVETIYVMMNDQAPRLLFNQRFNLGVDAKAVAGPRVAEAENTNRDLLETPVLVYTKSRGLFAGATVKTGFMTRNDDANRDFYGTIHTLPEILYSDWITPPAEMQPLMAYLQQLSP